MANKNGTKGIKMGSRLHELFTFDVDHPSFNAEIHFLPRHVKPAWYEIQWERYIAGYKAAGDRLIGTLRRYKVPNASCMVYPILYLYRHYLELRLKEIIESGNKLRPRAQRVESDGLGHNLVRAWQECQKIFKETAFEPEGARLGEASELIAQFSMLDRNSTDLRYPVRKPSKDSRRNVWEQREINLVKLSRYMKRVSSLLEKGSNWVQLTRDQAAEFSD